MALPDIPDGQFNAALRAALLFAVNGNDDDDHRENDVLHRWFFRRARRWVLNAPSGQEQARRDFLTLLAWRIFTGPHGDAGGAGAPHRAKHWLRRLGIEDAEEIG